ncbi:MAG: hypothetical protein JWM11_3521, partial [Planctomycetaceae bacterium]|nr:hypothetical protein [Planctomycetaceae bacterium]
MTLSQSKTRSNRFRKVDRPQLPGLGATFGWTSCFCWKVLVSLLWAAWIGVSCATVSGFGADRVWQATTPDGVRVSGQLSYSAARDLYFKQVGGKSDGRRFPLQQLDRMELPHRPRILPGVGLRQFHLANNDLLHARLSPLQDPAVRLRQQDLFLASDDKTRLTLSWNNIADILHSPGTRCLAEFNFESDSSVWSAGTIGQKTKLGVEHARSGKQSLKCSVEQSLIQYALSRPQSAGWIQFHFFLQNEELNPGENVVRFQFANRPRSAIPIDKLNSATDQAVTDQAVKSSKPIEICLSGPTSYYSAGIQLNGAGVT